MIKNLAHLGLDSDQIRRQRDASVSIGRAYLAAASSREAVKDWDLALLAAGTNLRRSAASSLLLGETTQGMELFDEAARVYSAAGTPYGNFLLNLGSGQPSNETQWEKAPQGPADVFWLWGPYSLHNAERLQQVVGFRHKLEDYRAERVGVLGYPVQTYLEIFDSLLLSDRDWRQRISEAIFPILGNFTTAIRRYRSDRYHWTRLAVPFHPAEPDVFALLVAIDKVLDTKRTTLRSIVETLPLGEDIRILLKGVLRQYHAWRRR